MSSLCPSTAIKRVSRQLRAPGKASLPGWTSPWSCSLPGTPSSCAERRWAVDTRRGRQLLLCPFNRPSALSPSQNRPALQAWRGTRSSAQAATRPDRLLAPAPQVSEASAPSAWQRAPNGGRGLGSPDCLPAPRRPPPRAQITQALPSLHPRSSLCTSPCSHRPPLSEPASLSSSPCSSYLDSCSEIHINHFYLSFENDTPGGYIQIFLYIFLLFTYLETEIAWSGDLSEVKLYYQPQI